MYSAEEVREVIAHDGVVAAHYRGVDVDRLQPATMTKGLAAYVSYRVGDRVYWTRHKVWIKPGETVLRDGARMLRARCGNCISTTPQSPVAAVDPGLGELDDFVIPLDDSRVDAYSAEAEPVLGSFLALPFGPQAWATIAPAVTNAGIDTLPALGFAPPASEILPGLPGVTSGPGPGNPFGGSTTGGTTTGNTTTGATTTGDTTTGGVTTGDTPTGSPDTTTGLTTGPMTTGVTDGSPTTGLPTGPVDTTGTTTTHVAPEPDVMWLLGCGAIALARRFRSRR